MNLLAKKLHARAQRKNRIRSKVIGTTERPRLSVHVSNMNITVQVIDDGKQKTLAAVTTAGQKLATGTMTEKAAWAGAEIAKKAKAVKVSYVVFDRGGRQYHGRVKALADAARAGGLKF